MGSCDKHMYSFIRNYHTLFQSGCSILPSHQQCMSDPLSAWICQHLALSLFFVPAILMWYILLAHFGLNLHSLMANNVKHCICPSVISVHPFCQFLIGLSSYCWAFKVFLYPRCKSFFRCVLCKYFLPVCTLPFHGLHEVFHRATILIWWISVYQVFSSMNGAFGFKSKNSTFSPKS